MLVIQALALPREMRYNKDCISERQDRRCEWKVSNYGYWYHPRRRH